jgi:hypothetical protein
LVVQRNPVYVRVTQRIISHGPHVFAQWLISPRNPKILRASRPRSRVIITQLGRQ